MAERMVASRSFLSREGSWRSEVSWVRMSLEGLVFVVIRGANLLRAARASSLPLLIPASYMSFINSGMMRSITIA